VDIKDYIDSGILELYVAGALDEAETRDVERMMAAHAEIRAEVEAITGTLEALARTNRRNPRPELRMAIMDRIAALENDNTAAKPATTARVIPITDGVTDTAAPRQEESAPWRRYLLAASIAIAMISTVLAVILGMNWRNARAELADVQQKNEVLARQIESDREMAQKTSRTLNTLQDANTRVVQLAGLPPAPAAKAVVYWNPETKEVYFNPGTLPPAPEGKEYQLWAIADNTPVDAGLFHITTGGAHPMKPIGAASAFAVTLEPAGGSPTPTGEMYVLGKL
jgi:anti-sigma-K factor RskA